MGAPISIHDSDVTMSLVNSGVAGHTSEALVMNVKLSRIITSVLNCKVFHDSDSAKSFALVDILTIKSFSRIRTRWPTE